jgi:hypothetical protein
MDIVERSLIDEIDSIYKLLDNMEHIIGDVPVSSQLSTAINRLADKTHSHDCYATREEVELLRNEIDRLNQLVGDTTVAEQINTALMK